MAVIALIYDMIHYEILITTLKKEILKKETLLITHF